jgi:hypothetical protein
MKMAKTNATQRSLKYLRERGWQCAIVEKWLPARGTMKFGVRQDVWGFGDILACRPKVYGEICSRCKGTGAEFLEVRNQTISCNVCFGKGQLLVSEKTIALIQTFPMARWKDHAEKLAAIPELQKWKSSGGIVIIHGWALKPKDGIRGAKKVWTLREELV